MTEFDSSAHLQEVLDSFEGCRDERFRTLISNAVRHLHALIVETHISTQELNDAIQFLTKAGQKCSETRQEFILLSDLLGISTLVVGLNQSRSEGCVEETVEGPFYWQGAPELALGADISNDVPGEKTFYYGNVLDSTGSPIANALLDVWSGDGEGNYDMQLSHEPAMRARGKFRTDHLGRYSFWSIKPNYYPIPTDGPAGLMQNKLGRHPNRPGHVHFKISADGFASVNTQLFPTDGPFLNSDCVFGVKPSLVIDFVQHPVGKAPDGKQLGAPYYTAQFDFRLSATESSSQG